MGFMLTSCGESVKDGIINDVNEYFTSAEAELAEIDNVEDFLIFVEVMNDRTDLLDLLQEKYGEKTISEEDQQAVEEYIYDRATAYNKAESARCTEFLTPAIERLEAIVNQMYPMFQAGTAFDQETLDEFVDAYTAVTDFSVCENVDSALVERLDPTFTMEDEMSETIIARLDEIYPDEE